MSNDRFLRNSYVQLLADFQHAYAEFGDTLFFLGIVNEEELKANPGLRDSLFCHLPLAADGSGWHVLGSRRNRA
jgi:hypothetical protein